MKKFLILSSALALSAIIYMSCQKEISIPNSEEVSASSKRGPVNEVTITEPAFTLTSSTGAMACVGEEVTITWGAAASCGQVRLDIWDIANAAWTPAPGTAGSWQNPATGNKSFVFLADGSRLGTCATAGYLFRVQYNTGNASGNGCTGGQPPYSAGFSTELCVGVEQCEGCQYEGNEFNGTAVSCSESREAVYTFGSEDGVGYFKMQGGLTNFTGANATVYINGTEVNFNSTSGDGWLTGTVDGYTIGQRTPGGSSNRNIRVEGSLGTCTGVIVRIVWTSTNSGGIITGDWSVKDAGGVDLAPSIDGLTCGG